LEIATGFTTGHVTCMERLVESAKHFGYKFLLYDYECQGRGIPFKVDFGSYSTKGRASYKPKFCHKPELVIHAFYTMTGKFLTYMDADTEFNAPINDVMTDDYDVGFTADPYDLVISNRRHVYKDIAGWLNAGVIFFNKNDNTRRFLGLWKAARNKCDSQSDQHALHNIAFKAFDREKDWYPGKIREYKGVRIKLFDGTIYNYVPQYKLPCPETPRILHHIGSGCNYA